MRSGKPIAATISNSPQAKGNTFIVDIEFSKPVTNVRAPFNPFLFRRDNREHEIHLLGNRPSEFFNLNLFGTLDDRSEPSLKRYYTGKNGFTWAMLLDSSWKHPLEKIDIALASTNFSRWVQSGGKQHTTWMQDSPKNGTIWTRP